jgi:hypothetical protein
MLKKKLAIILSFARKRIEEMTNEKNKETSNVSVEVIVRSTILSHFIKGKNLLTPMEIILIISSEFEYLECLIKLAWKWKDVEAKKIQMVVVQKTHVISQINVNRTHHNETLHFVMRSTSPRIEGLVDIKASMYVMAIIVVRELGIIHLVVGREIYNTTFGIVTQALGRINQILIIFSKIICQMVFLVIDMDNYD